MGAWRAAGKPVSPEPYSGERERRETLEGNHGGKARLEHSPGLTSAASGLAALGLFRDGLQVRYSREKHFSLKDGAHQIKTEPEHSCPKDGAAMTQ